MDRGIVVTKVALFALAVLFAGSTAGLAAQQSSLEKLLNVAPDDAIFVAGTSGGDEMGPAFKETVIGKMWADQQTQAFYVQIRDTLIGKIKDEVSPKDFNEISAVADTALLVFSRPRMVVAAGRQAGPGEFPAYLSVIVNAGPSRDAIAEKVRRIEAMAGSDDIKDATIAGCKMHSVAKAGAPSVYWGMQGDYFVFAVNDPNGFALRNLKNGGSSAASCLSKVAPNGDAFAAYINITKIKSLVQSVKDCGEVSGKMTVALKSLGLDNVKTYVTRTGFVGGQFVTESFVEAPGPRTGILAAFKPVDMKAFDAVDPNSISACVMNVDSAVIFDTVMSTVKNLDENASKEVADGIATFETKSGVKVREGIIASLAGPVMVYSVPGGPADASLGGGSGVLIADLKDQAKFEENIAALATFIANESKGSLQISTQTIGDRKLNVWMVPQMAMVGFVPTWTVVNGKLVVGTSQQICKAAADRVASPAAGKSLSSLPAFRSATAGLPAGLTSVRYLDSGVYFKMLMSQVQRAWPMVTMAVSQSGVALPYILPDLSQYASQMKPGVEYSWSDKDGIHARVKGSGIEQSIGGVAGAAVGVAILMPALAKAKEKAQDVRNMNKLKEVGLAMVMYADSHGGLFPQELNDLVKDANFSPATLQSKRKPADFTGPDYLYVAGQKTSAPGDSVLVYENPGYCSDRLAVLFVDGHVEMAAKSDFKADLKKTYERLGQPMPKVKFKDDKSSGNGKKAATQPAEPNK